MSSLFILLLGLVLFGLTYIYFNKMGDKKSRIGYYSIVGLIVFLTFSLIYVNLDYNYNVTSVEGTFSLIGVYFQWLLTVGSNLMRVTGYAVNQDWSGNISAVQNLTNSTQ